MSKSNWGLQVELRRKLNTQYQTQPAAGTVHHRRLSTEEDGNRERGGRENRREVNGDPLLFKVPPQNHHPQ